MLTHTDFLRVAIEEANEALREDELPVGAVVVLYDEVISRAHRRKNTNTRLDHAEMVALRDAIDLVGTRTIREATLYSTLEPCIMCFGAVLNCYLQKVAYALEDPFGGATSHLKSSLPVRHLPHVPEVIGGMLREESRSLFAQYFATTKNSFWSAQPDNPLVLLCKPPTSR